jgi:hypothetical protein
MLGDRLDPALEMISRGDIDYIAFDNLGELTISDLQRRRLREPDKGYADIRRTLSSVMKPCVEKGIRVITNAGGINPQGAAQRTVELAQRQGLKGLKVAAVAGDDTVGQETRGRIAGLRSKGVSLSHLDTGEEFSLPEEAVVGMSVYLGAFPVAEALERGGQVVITGRYADAALWLAPQVYEFGWGEGEWDRLAHGTVVGHLLECTGLVCGGSFTDWRKVPGLERLGYPIAEVSDEGQAVITKTEGSGGIVNAATVKLQLLYEIGDPTAYITPDVVADFTSVQVDDLGGDRVRISGVRGRPRTDSLKAVIGYLNGYMAEGCVTFGPPLAEEKARDTALMLERRFRILGIAPLEVNTEFIGLNALTGPLTPPSARPAEVMLRMALRVATEGEASRFLQEFYPLYVAGPPAACGIIVQPPRQVVSLWPTLIPREEARWGVDMMEVP